MSSRNVTRPPTYDRHRHSTLLATSAPRPVAARRRSDAGTQTRDEIGSRLEHLTLSIQPAPAYVQPPSYLGQDASAAQRPKIRSLRRLAADTYFQSVLKRDLHMTMAQVVTAYRTDLSDCLVAQLLQIQFGDWDAYTRLRQTVNESIGEVVVPAMNARKQILKRAPEVAQPLDALKAEIRQGERRHHGEFLAESEYTRVFGNLGKAAHAAAGETGTRHDPELMGVDDYSRMEKRARFIAQQVSESNLGDKLLARFDHIADGCQSTMRVTWELLMDCCEAQKQAYIANIDRGPSSQSSTSSVFSSQGGPARRFARRASSTTAGADFAEQHRHKQLMLVEAHSAFVAIQQLRKEFEPCVTGETRRWPPVRDFWKLLTQILASPRRAARTVDAMTADSPFAASYAYPGFGGFAQTSLSSSVPSTTSLGRLFKTGSGGGGRARGGSVSAYGSSPPYATNTLPGMPLNAPGASGSGSQSSKLGFVPGAYDPAFIDTVNALTNDAAERFFAAVTDWLVCCMARASLAALAARHRTKLRVGNAAQPANVVRAGGEAVAGVVGRSARA